MRSVGGVSLSETNFEQKLARSTTPLYGATVVSCGQQDAGNTIKQFPPKIFSQLYLFRNDLDPFFR